MDIPRSFLGVSSPDFKPWPPVITDQERASSVGENFWKIDLPPKTMLIVAWSMLLLKAQPAVAAAMRLMTEFTARSTQEIPQTPANEAIDSCSPRWVQVHLSRYRCRRRCCLRTPEIELTRELKIARKRFVSFLAVLNNPYGKKHLDVR